MRGPVTPQQQMEAVFEWLADARERPASISFERAMEALVRIYDREAVYGPVDPATRARFRQESAKVIAGFGFQVTRFVDATLDDVASGDPCDWVWLSLRRSAIQLLIEDYAGTLVAALALQGSLSELDAELRKFAPEKAPVPERSIPKGLPDGHWWWRLPNPPTDTLAQLRAAILMYLENTTPYWRPDAETYIYLALTGLVELRSRESACETPDAATRAEFRRIAGSAIANLGGEVPGFASAARAELKRARDEDWYWVALRRSALQLLLDDFPGTGIAELLLEDGEHDLEKLDEQLRQFAREREPFLIRPAPSGLPDSHWWWQLPAREAQLSEPSRSQR